MNWKWKLAQAAEIRWWRSYLSRKTPENYLRDKRAYWIRLMKQAGIEVPPKVSVLDAGCGPAGIFTVLNQQQVDAVDPLLPLYTSQLLHFDPDNYPNVRFVTKRLEQFQPGKSYEVIFCLNAINHVADIQLAMDRLIACLEPQGKLWLSIDAHRYQALQWIFRLIPADILHPHQFTLKEYEEMLIQRGMEVLQSIQLKPGRIFDYYLIEAKLI